MSTSTTLPDVPVPDDTRLTKDDIDEDRIIYCYICLLGLYGSAVVLNPSSVSITQFKSHPLVRSLTDKGITTFSELIALGGDAVTHLRQGPETITKRTFNNVTGVMESFRTLVPAGPLEGRWTHLTRALIAYYHHQSRIINRSIEIRTVHPVHFGHFRVNTYIPDDSIIS